MELHWIDDEVALAEGAADWIAARLAAAPGAAVALATGRTPRGLYRRLVQRRAAGVLGGGKARFFNLDEFVGLPAEDPRNYSAYLWKHVLGPLEVPAAQVRTDRQLAVEGVESEGVPMSPVAAFVATLPGWRLRLGQPNDGLSWLHRDGPPGPIWSHLVTQSSRASMPRATKNRRSLMANGTGPGRGARDPERGETALQRRAGPAG